MGAFVIIAALVLIVVIVYILYQMEKQAAASLNSVTNPFGF